MEEARRPLIVTRAAILVEIENYHQYLLLALREAEMRRGFTAPNPSVGAVVAKDNRVIAAGKHWASGHPHAEVDALQKITDDINDAILFVTLEPCCHHGRTPPCTDLIIKRGIKRVIFSEMDPNPEVAGKGRQVLREAGIECRQITMPAITEFYHSYVYWVQKHRPWVTMKLAISADNKFAALDGSPLKITGEAANEFTHQWRQRSDALLTTMQTIINDDPKMNVRTAAGNISKPIYILDSQLRLPLHAKIFKTTKDITLYHREDCDISQINSLQARGIRCVAVDTESPRHLNLEKILDDIGQEGVHDLWVEVGAHCFQSFYKANLAQRIFILQSQKIIGDAAPAFSNDFNPLVGKRLDWRALGEDAYCELTMISIDKADAS